MINILKMLEVTNIKSNHQYNNVNQTKHHSKGQGQKNDKYEQKNENVPC